VHLHTHLAENDNDIAYTREKFGCTPAEYAEQLGWLGPDVWHAHCVKLDAAGIAALPPPAPAWRTARAATCAWARASRPSARCATPACRWRWRWTARPATTAATCWPKLRLGLLLQRVAFGAGAMGAREMLEMATLGGARVLGRDDIGALAPGMAAAIWPASGWMTGAGRRRPRPRGRAAVLPPPGSERLATLSGGRYRAEIVPFDRAGIRGAELLPMVRLGTVPFGTLLLSQAAPRDAELVAADLAGLSADMATLRKVVAAWRPRLAALLRERHGAELLAVYAYPAQVLFCKRALEGLEGLRGLRVRTASPTQADFVRALGGEPLTVPLAQLLTRMGSGGLDCAITGTMTGHTIGLDGITTHLLPLPVSWGLAVFVAHGPSWQALPGPLRELLQQELPRLEAAIWDEAERETAEGIVCSTGQGPVQHRPGCTHGLGCARPA
jgi:hypothetical protein